MPLDDRALAGERRRYDSSVLTAFGVYQGMRASAQHTWGDPSLRGRRVGVAGVGKVGHHLVEHLRAEGAEVVVTDVREDAVRRILDRHPQGVTAVADTEALIRTEGLDIYAPCALGGALNDASVPVLTAGIVCGAANNQLAHPGVEKDLADRGILYAPDYVVNAAWGHPGRRRAPRVRFRPVQGQGVEDLRHHARDLRTCEGGRDSATRRPTGSPSSGCTRRPRRADGEVPVGGPPRAPRGFGRYRRVES